jgi:hypothetical protein
MAEPGDVSWCGSTTSVMVFSEAAWLEDPAGVATLAKPKIQNFSVAALGDENVCGLDVTVDNALGMGGIQAIGNLNGQR